MIALCCVHRLLGQAFSLMIATISPAASALKHTRSTLHYATTATSIALAPPKKGSDDLEQRNSELEQVCDRALGAQALPQHGLYSCCSGL